MCITKKANALQKVISMFINFSFEDNHLKLFIFGIRFLSFHIKRNNHIYIINKDGSRKKVKRIAGLKIKFTQSNSSVTVQKPFIKLKNNTITLGENCHVVIKNKTNEKLSGLQNVNIDIYQNSRLEFGSDFYNASSFYLLCNSDLKIGNDCMFSSNLKFLCGDSHKIMNKETNEITSNKHNVSEIGEHVWIGYDSTFLRNAEIADGSIVGASSVISKKFNEPNVVIAGNPAKIVKHGIEWDK